MVKPKTFNTSRWNILYHWLFISPSLQEVNTFKAISCYRRQDICRSSKLFINCVMWYKLGENEKDKRVNLKCWAFTWRIVLEKFLLVCSWIKVVAWKTRFNSLSCRACLFYFCSGRCCLLKTSTCWDAEIGLLRRVPYLKRAVSKRTKVVVWCFKGNLCYCLQSDSILGYSIVTPHYLAGLTSWIWRL